MINPVEFACLSKSLIEYEGERKRPSSVKPLAEPTTAVVFCPKVTDGPITTKSAPCSMNVHSHPCGDNDIGSLLDHEITSERIVGSQCQVRTRSLVIYGF